MSGNREAKQIKELIIHCAATPNGRWHDAKDINQWHGEKGFIRDPALMRFQQPELDHIGYHFVIGIKGGVETGRGKDEIGAHARGHNRISLGTCLIGTNQFTPAQWKTLAEHVKSLMKSHPGLKVIGHCEVNPHKICPGFDVQAWLQSGMVAPDRHILKQED